MKNFSATALKAVLIVLGLYGLFISIDFGWGGFATLGWQGSTDFLQITDSARYGVQDSHFRFLAGAFSVVSAFVIFAVTDLQRHQKTLNLIFALIFVGGVTRFTSANFGVLFGTEIIVALFAEIGLMLILYVWLRRVVSRLPNQIDQPLKA